MKNIKVSKKDKIAYDPHMLDGIEFIDVKSAVSYIKSMIPSSEYDRSSPYVPIRKLVKFFDKNKGQRRIQPKMDDAHTGEPRPGDGPVIHEVDPEGNHENDPVDDGKQLEHQQTLFNRSQPFALLGVLAALVPTTLAGHPFWNETDPQARAGQLTQLLKNVGMAGGLLAVMASGSRKRCGGHAEG